MKVIIYSKNNCVFCTKAKHLVKTLGLEYTEKKMEEFDSPQALYPEMMFLVDPIADVEDIVFVFTCQIDLKITGEVEGHVK